MKNHSPIPLLPICAKILERIIVNHMIEYFTENSLNSANLSGVRSGDSINQILSIIIKSKGPLISHFQLQGYFRTF